MNYENEFKKYAQGHKGFSSMKTETYIKSQVQDMTRTVIEERPVNFREIDVFSRLMADRIIFLGTQIDDYFANIIQAQLLFLQSMDGKRDIHVYINSPGGSVYAGLGIYDTMQFITPEIATINTGMAASMAAVLLCAGAKGKRAALKQQPAKSKSLKRNFIKSLPIIPSNPSRKLKPIATVIIG